MDRRLRVAMVLVAFPTPEVPHRGIFNFRSAQRIAALADLRVIRLRTWLPGRRRWSSYEQDGLQVDTICELQLHGAAGFNRSRFAAGQWERVRRVLDNCDLIHSVGAETAGVVAAAWAQQARLPHILQIIGSDVYSVLPNLKLKGELSEWHRHVDAVAAVCDAIGNAFAELHPDVATIRTIYRGTDLDRFKPAGKDGESGRSGGGVRFLYLGGFPGSRGRRDDIYRKGGHLLLEAWLCNEDRLSTAGATLTLAGRGAAPANRTVHRYMKQLRKPGNVTLAGALPPQAVPGQLQGTDVVVIPSFEEGLPNVAVEAAACGVPVIGTDVGGMREVVRDGETGWVIPPGAPAALGEALLRAAGGRERFTAMGAEARRHAERNFNAEEYAPRMLELYRETVANFTVAR